MSPSKETDTHMVYVSMTGKVVRFPKVARYRRNADRVYTINSFADGELVTFSNFSGNAQRTEDGNAWYFGQTCKHGDFINVDELEEIVTDDR